MAAVVGIRRRLAVLTVASLLLWAAADQAAAEPGAGTLTQLSGAFGCFSTGGSEGCAAGPGLRGASSVVTSPDGRYVYVASNNSSAVTLFRRNTRTGVLRALGCWSSGGREGCEPARGLSGAFSLTITPDGRHLYVASFRAVASFARNARTGRLAQLGGGDGCVSQDAADGCTRGRALASTAWVASSPDGRSIYVASVSSNAVAVFARNPSTGALSQLPGPDGCQSEGGTEGCVRARALAGAFSVTVSPSGQHVYVASLSSNAVAVFERDPDSGALDQLPGVDGCVSEGGTEGCTAGRGLASPNAVLIDPSGGNLYVASSGSGAVAAFARDREAGFLDQLDGALGCMSQGGSEGCATGRALDGVFSLGVSLDGNDVYAVSGSAVVSLTRIRQTGALAELADPEACTSQGGTQRCLTGRALREASSVAVAPDGRNAYVASYRSNAVAVFARNPQRAAIRIRIRGVPHSCARRSFRARVSIRSTLPMRRVSVRLDRRRLGSRAGSRRLTVLIRPRRLRRGRHRLRIDARDVGGNLRRKTVRFRRCGA